MRAFLRRRRWCLLAAGFLPAVFVAVFLLVQDPDGSRAALEHVQPGMAREQVVAILSGAHRNGDFSSYFSDRYLRYSFRDYSVFVTFDGNTRVVEKSRQKNITSQLWWEPPLAYWNRVKAKLGL
jgi:hypothetical protein